jgi:hypothetical protein
MVYKYGFSTPNELNRGNIDLQGVSFFVQVSQLFQESGIGYTVKIVVGAWKIRYRYIYIYRTLLCRMNCMKQ